MPAELFQIRHDVSVGQQPALTAHADQPGQHPSRAPGSIAAKASTDATQLALPPSQSERSDAASGHPYEGKTQSAERDGRQPPEDPADSPTAPSRIGVATPFRSRASEAPLGKTASPLMAGKRASPTTARGRADQVQASATQSKRPRAC
jgi:hypothetical protein